MSCEHESKDMGVDTYRSEYHHQAYFNDPSLTCKVNEDAPVALSRLSLIFCASFSPASACQHGKPKIHGDSDPVSCPTKA